MQDTAVKGQTGTALPVRVIRPAKRRVRPSEIWTSRKVAWIVAMRDMKVRYKQSVLGPPWLIIQPLGILVGLIFVFDGVTTVNTGDIPYPIFALVGMAAWTFVQTALANGALVLVANIPLIRRVAFPRTAFYTATLLAAVPGCVVILVVAFGGIVVKGLHIPTQIVLLPVAILILLVMMAGTLFIVASLGARFRDVAALVPFWSQAGLFLTPVGYPVSQAPPNVRTMLDLNPLTGVVELWRWCLLGTSVEALALVSMTVGVVGLAIGGWRLFARMETRFADFI